MGAPETRTAPQVPTLRDALLGSAEAIATLRAFSRRIASLDERIWSKVKPGEGCWNWQGSRIVTTGYGQVGIGTRSNGSFRIVTAHRLAYALTRGPIPRHLVVCHRCNNRSCVRPSHLYLDTPAGNTRQAWLDGLVHPRLGERSPAARISNNQVLALRAEWQKRAAPDNHVRTASVRRLALNERYPNAELIRELSAQFGIAKPTVDGIVKGRTWKWLLSASPKMESPKISMIA